MPGSKKHWFMDEVLPSVWYLERFSPQSILNLESPLPQETTPLHNSIKFKQHSSIHQTVLHNTQTPQIPTEPAVKMTPATPPPPSQPELIGIIELHRRFQQGQYLTSSPGNPNNRSCGNYSFQSTCGHVVSFSKKCRNTISLETLEPVLCSKRAAPRITVTGVVVNQPCKDCGKGAEIANK